MSVPTGAVELAVRASDPHRSPRSGNGGISLFLTTLGVASAKKGLVITVS